MTAYLGEGIESPQGWTFEERGLPMNPSNQTSYKNPWHHPLKPEYGPAFFATSATPQFYKGYAIYQRIEGRVWDVVRNGVCVTQMAGPNGARRAIDELTSPAAQEQLSA